MEKEGLLQAGGIYFKK